MNSCPTRLWFDCVLVAVGGGDPLRTFQIVINILMIIVTSEGAVPPVYIKKKKNRKKEALKNIPTNFSTSRGVSVPNALTRRHARFTPRP